MSTEPTDKAARPARGDAASISDDSLGLVQCQCQYTADTAISTRDELTELARQFHERSPESGLDESAWFNVLHYLARLPEIQRAEYEARHRPLSLDEIVLRVPEVGGLIERAKACRDRCQACAFYGVWDRDGYRYPGFKEEIVRLVGWHSQHPDPTCCTSQAYEAAYHAVLDAIPYSDECVICGRDVGEVDA